jgi:hypothetical protein
VIAAFLRAMRGRPPDATHNSDQDDDSPAFVSGLALGALVGAAIAGSTLWRRFHGGSRDTPDDPGAGTETSVGE